MMEDKMIETITPVIISFNEKQLYKTRNMLQQV